jgi:hypothetical protein
VKTKLPFARLLLGLLFLNGLAGRPAWTAENLTTAAIESITQQDLRRHITYLASDALEGREAGSAGAKAAAAYLGEKFQAYGLQPAGQRGQYEQHFGQDYRNLLGLRTGSDEKLKHEVIVIGAHYDHVGYGYSGNSRGTVGQIHNGADDNASGVAALLEIAQALHESKLSFRRSVLFALWDGEEVGLLGSRHWTSSPTVEFSRVRFYLNLDMVGRLRNNRLEVYGVRTSTGLRRLYVDQNQEGIETDFNWNLIGDSDHYPFLQRDVPFLMPFTGKHEDYHRPTDKPHTLNYAGAERVTRHWFRILHELANRDELPKFRRDARNENETLRRRFETESAPGESRLGISWRSDESDPEKALTIRNIARPSAAWNAGLRVGDQILELNGKPFENTLQFISDVRTAAGESVLTVRKQSEDSEEEGDSPREISISLDGFPDLTGLTWKVDRADRGALVIASVAVGSPADSAGLRANDRLLAIDGMVIESPVAGRRALSRDDRRFSIRYERNGRPREARLSPRPLLRPPVRELAERNSAP